VNDRRGGVLLRASGLRVARGSREVVRGIDFELRAGEITALLGPNGAGKSTLLEALAGLLPVAAGDLEAFGQVALALQSPDLAKRTVVANVQLALGWWGVPRGERRDRAELALEAMQASHLRDRAARSLSGGERRRVHLARAVSVRTDILLLDEPFAGLDAATRATLLDDTGAALRAWAATTLVVVHDRAEAWALADRLLVMIDGRLVADGPPRELLTRPPSVEVARFLGFDGTLAGEGGELLLTRTQHVVLDPASELRARVARAIPVEDGLRLELELDRGRVYALAPLPAAAAGELVGVRLIGGVRFSANAQVRAQDAAVPSDPPHSVMP
jgi:ABC-type sulfate/molybdate transport systems ATPase subunit